MADLLSSGLSFLADQLQAHAATTVTYRRGVQQVSLPATIGQTEFRRGLIELLKERYVRGDLTMAEYESRVRHILLDPALRPPV